MDYALNELQLKYKNLAANFAKEQVKPVFAQLDKDQNYSGELVRNFAKAGLYNAFTTEKFGGEAHSPFCLALVFEEIAKVCGGAAFSFFANLQGAIPIYACGNDAQKQNFIPKLGRGEAIFAAAVYEPEINNTDLIKTTFTRENDGFVLNGTKTFVFGEADFYTVFATSSEGEQSFFVVEKSAKGLSFDVKDDKLGLKTAVSSRMKLENVKVPFSAKLEGKDGRMFAKMFLIISRLLVASISVGVSENAQELAIAYTKERKQFGSPVFEKQAVQFMLAENLGGMEAARALVYSAARSMENKIIGETDSAIAKLIACEVCAKTTTDAVQLFGGYGYMRDFPVEKHFRDAKTLQVLFGTSQFLKDLIGKQVAGK
ncbi:acyl-CoA dehydrogenase family protein [bacterium]|nr:acyl-CoA dehydrogenase family protein [bacterium]